MHYEIINCYFKIFFGEVQLKKENLKNVFVHHSLVTQIDILASLMAWIHQCTITITNWFFKFKPTIKVSKVTDNTFFAIIAFGKINSFTYIT